MANISVLDRSFLYLSTASSPGIDIGSRNEEGEAVRPHSGLGRAGYTDGGLCLVFRPFRGSGQILSKVKYSDSRIPASSTPMAGAMPIRSGCFFEIPAQMTDRFDQPGHIYSASRQRSRR